MRKSCLALMVWPEEFRTKIGWQVQKLPASLTLTFL